MVQSRGVELLPSSMFPTPPHLSTVEERLLGFVAEGVNPLRMIYATYPHNGFFEPIPAGETTIDLRDMKIRAPHQNVDLANIIVRDEIRSLSITVDSLVVVEGQPIIAKFALYPGTVTLPARGLDRIILTADTPYFLHLAWSTVFSAQIRQPFYGCLQRSTILPTLTKANGSGIPDTFSKMLFVPRMTGPSLGTVALADEATYGNSLICTMGYKDKLFIVHQTALLDGPKMDIRLRGYALWQEFYGPVTDPDPNAGGGAGMTVPERTTGVSTELPVVVLRSSTPFAYMEMEARVASEYPAGTEGRLRVEMFAQRIGENS